MHSRVLANTRSELSGGSDGDWGCGTCGDAEDWAWSLNSDSQYNTLVRIPDPSVQPK